MPTVTEDHQLTEGERPNPILWLVTAPVRANALRLETEVSDEAMHYALGEGKARALKSFGHDSDGVHFLLLRGGTGLHTDTAYTRYTMQLVLRNDGTRIRGLASYDDEWHPPMYPGVMYCLDTHSPHIGCPDPRMNPPRTGFMKAVIAVDRDEPLDPAGAWRLLAPYTARQFTDFEITRRPPRGAAARAGG